MTAPKASADRVFGLDLLRATAVLMVLVAHSRFLVRPLMPWTRGLSFFGFVGVELFFVLSGFLIGGIILKTFPETPTGGALVSFWVRRWFRTLPNYYLFLALNVAIWTAQGNDTEGLVSYGLFLQNIAWPSHRFFNESWSLAVEEWFYLLFPIFLLLGSKFTRTTTRACVTALVALFLLSTGARVAAVGWSEPSWDEGVRKVVIYRLDAIMIGVLGAYVKINWPAFWERVKIPLVPVGVVLFVVVAAMYYGLNRQTSVLARTVMFNLTPAAAFAFLPLLDDWRTASGGLAKWVQRISLWSYSLYLCNLPVMDLTTAVLGDPSKHGDAMSASRIIGVTVIFVVVSLAVAALTYTFFEKPATDLRERFGTRRRSPKLAG